MLFKFMENISLKNIIEKFTGEADLNNIVPLKIGFINDSYIVGNIKPGERSFFLQRINQNVFKNVEGLMKNISLVTEKIREKLAEEKEDDLERKALQIIPTKTGHLFHYNKEDNSFWRMYYYINGTHSYDSINPELAYKAGKAFGKFQFMLSDISENELIETIPNFHNMEFRLHEFREAVKNNTAGRLNEIKWLVEEIEQRAQEMCLPERLYRDGKLPKRINHCDTKVNNLLFDENDEPICIVDLDTVMPSFVLSDFGDFMRTAANTGAEDDVNIENVSFDLKIFQSYTTAYLKEAKNFLSELEIELLPLGAKLLTYMQLCRFLTDYLNGDVYYKIEYPSHNLQRSKAQLKLLQSMEENFDAMKNFISQQMNLL